MILKFVIACHVSTIPKSPPKIIRENTYTDQEGQFFLCDFLALRIISPPCSLTRPSGTLSHSMDIAREGKVLHNSIPPRIGEGELTSQSCPNPCQHGILAC